MAIFLIVGNPVIEGDNVVHKIMDRLRRAFPQHEFTEYDPNEGVGILENKDGVYFIDAVKGLSRVEVLTEKDIDKLRDFPKVSAHDFDFTFHLKLLSKLGVLKEIKIIGVPYGMEEEEAYTQLREIIQSIGR